MEIRQPGFICQFRVYACLFFCASMRVDICGQSVIVTSSLVFLIVYLAFLIVLWGASSDSTPYCGYLRLLLSVVLSFGIHTFLSSPVFLSILYFSVYLNNICELLTTSN